MERVCVREREIEGGRKRERQIEENGSKKKL